MMVGLIDNFLSVFVLSSSDMYLIELTWNFVEVG
jgi:hypothetical protein